MSKICTKCNRVIDYNSYFKVDICRYCGWEEDSKVNTIATYRFNTNPCTLKDNFKRRALTKKMG